MTQRLRTAHRRLWIAWMSVQVEFQGRYSIKRLQQLDVYSTRLSSLRLLVILLLTPLPSLAISLLKELLPLNSPDAGVFNNNTFFVRAWLILAFINGNILVQVGQNAPRLKLTTAQVVAFALLSSGVSITAIFLVCVLTVFPLPFGLLAAALPDVTMMRSCFVYAVGSRWKADSSLWNDVKRQLSLFYCQVALTFIYPVYIYGFVSLTGVHQTMFVTLLPVIQIAAKNWVSHQITDNDLKPESVIFTVEVFNALYVANALHRSTSWKTTAMILAIDCAHFWISMLDVVEILNDLKSLMTKIPRSHPIARENFVRVAMRLVEIESMSTTSGKTSSTTVSRKPLEARLEAWVSSRDALSKGSTSRRDTNPVIGIKDGRTPGKLLMPSAKARVFPVRPPQRRQWNKRNVSDSPDAQPKFEFNNTVNPAVAALGLEAIFSRKERALFIRKSARVLFITEYIVLIEYAEVALPIIYCFQEMVLFNMHNRVYYPALAGMTSAELLSSVENVLLYSSVQFLSLVMALVVLKRMLGFSSLKQLAFVLEMQAPMVQSKLVTLFLYVMQVPLVHNGADFSFKFAWAHKD